MKVTLRHKSISGGRQSLYLDFYPPIPYPHTGKLTRREFLGLYFFDKPRTELERHHNKQTKLLAEHVRANRQLEVQAGRYGFLQQTEQTAAVDFLAWLKQQADHRQATNQTKARANWQCLHSHLVHFIQQRYASRTLFTDALTEQFVQQFKDYLTTAPNLNTRRGQDRRLAYGTAVSYFVLFKTLIKHAVRDGVLKHNIAEQIRPFKPRATERTFLSLAELQAMAQAECGLPELKRAGLFSALTGLRYSDVEKLVWREVQDDPAGSTLRFVQRKTQEAETLPLNKQARALLGERGAEDERAFPDLLYSSHQNAKLREWALAAGITRPITFHAFRHTFATLQLQHGTDIYTVSKLLGHHDLKTTQIYARIVDEQKRTAVNRLWLAV